MEGTAKWCTGGFVAILGIIGLFMAANAHDRGIYLFGLAVFAFAIIYVFSQIKQGYDSRDRMQRESLEGPAG
jgi:hypothetical protein